MKNTFVFVLFIVVLAMIISRRNFSGSYHYDGKVENYKITINRIESVPYKQLMFKEINYFETEKNISNWYLRSDEENGLSAERSEEYCSQGKYSMKVNWKTSEWAEIVFVHFPEDWYNYDIFTFDIINPDKEKVEFEMKIGDKFDSDSFYYYSQKFVMKNKMKPGLNSYIININDIAKKIDIKSERKVIHFSIFEKNKIFYLDNMRLEI